MNSLDGPFYWDQDDQGGEEPTCRLCGSTLHTPNEERRGLCYACYEEEEEDLPMEEEIHGP